MSGELRPARKTERARDDKLRRRQQALAVGELCPCKRLDPGCAGLDVVRRLQCLQPVLQRRQPIDPADRPPTNRRAVAGLAGRGQILRELSVLFEIRSWYEWKRFLRIRVHTNLLSSRAWSPLASG